MKEDVEEPVFGDLVVFGGSQNWTMERVISGDDELDTGD